MAIEFNDIDDLIGKVLSGEASADEQLEVRNWCASSPDNQKYFDDLKVIFIRASANQVKVDFDADAAWNKVRSRLSRKTGAKVVEMPVTQPARWPALRIAAGIVIVMSASILAWRWYTDVPLQTAELKSDAKVVQDTLPDGSTAVLNKKSSITYEYNAREKTRKVKLKGEGYFNVVHEEEKPFVIEAEEALVRDIGTSFNIRSYPDKDTIEVVVQTGIVQFYTKSDPGLMINEGETGYYSKSRKEFTKLAKADTNVLAYKTRVFSFNHTDLRSVVNQINDVYDSKIKLANDQIAGCQLSATFRDDELLTIVEVIAESLSLRYTKTEDGDIIFDGTCTK